jgi:hypothetical protein
MHQSMKHAARRRTFAHPAALSYGGSSVQQHLRQGGGGAAITPPARHQCRPRRSCTIHRSSPHPHPLPKALVPKTRQEPAEGRRAAPCLGMACTWQPAVRPSAWRRWRRRPHLQDARTRAVARRQAERILWQLRPCRRSRDSCRRMLRPALGDTWGHGASGGLQQEGALCVWRGGAAEPARLRPRRAVQTRAMQPPASLNTPPPPPAATSAPHSTGPPLRAMARSSMSFNASWSSTASSVAPACSRGRGEGARGGGWARRMGCSVFCMLRAARSRRTGCSVFCMLRAGSARPARQQRRAGNGFRRLAAQRCWCAAPTSTSRRQQPTLRMATASTRAAHESAIGLAPAASSAAVAATWPW